MEAGRSSRRASTETRRPSRKEACRQHQHNGPSSVSAAPASSPPPGKTSGSTIRAASSPSSPFSAKQSPASNLEYSPRSDLLRSRGNEFYKQASQDRFCFTMRRAKISHALQLYTQALHVSVSSNEQASCYKNLGMLHWLSCKVELKQKLADLEASLGSPTTKHFSLFKVYLGDAVKSLLQAKMHGEKAKSQAWLDQLHKTMITIIQWATEKSSLVPLSHSPLLQFLCEAFENAYPLTSPLCLLAYKCYAEALFKEALAMKLSDNTVDYKGCYNLLHHCRLSLKRAESCPVLTEQDRHLLQEILELQHSVHVHLCICEAMQAIALGDECLSEALLGGEDMDMEKVKDSLDLYRQSSMALQELDVETEGVAMSRIGKVYSDVLGLEEAGHKYHLQATRLALTGMSPSIARSDWYKYSLGKVKEHQGRVAEKEREQHEKDREPIMQRLKKKVEALCREARGSTESFLKYVYKEHPHPDLKRNLVLRFPRPEDLKVSLKKAILHYHPDSNVQYGEDWKVLCEEICKHLNVKYGLCFKSVQV